MPDPRDGKCGKMPHYCPGRWALLELIDALVVRVLLFNTQCTTTQVWSWYSQYQSPSVNNRDPVIQENRFRSGCALNKAKQVY